MVIMQHHVLDTCPVKTVIFSKHLLSAKVNFLCSSSVVLFDISFLFVMDLRMLFIVFFSYHLCLTCDHLAPQPLVQSTELAKRWVSCVVC